VKSIRESKLGLSNNLEGEAVRNQRTQSKSFLRNNPPVSTKTNETLGVTFNKLVNDSVSNVDIKTFREKNQNSKFHLLFDKQLEELFLIFKKSKFPGVPDFRTNYVLFISSFNKCDKDNDHLLNAAEFTNCMKNDTYLGLIPPPGKLYATNKEFFSNDTAFSSYLFRFADNYDKKGLNLYDYVQMRLFAFAWRKCSLNSPFIDEAGFECAIDKISTSKSAHTHILRKIFQMGLELGNTHSHPVRTLDFAMFYSFASSIRLFGRINVKDDLDATIAEFNLALDTNILPSRFSQEIIGDIFKLVKTSSSKAGLDLYSFCFYDFYLKLYYQGYENELRWRINLKDFQVILNNFLLPSFITNYIKQVPEANYTAESYNLRAHINSQHLSEEEYFEKFLELRSEISNSNKRHNNTNFHQSVAARRLFKLLDSDEENYLSFYDFGNFIQVFYLYYKTDTKHADRVLVGDIYNSFTEKSGFPIYSDDFREKSNRFSNIDQDLYIDPFFTLAVVRMDNYVNHYTRKSDPTTVKEIELNLIFDRIGVKNFPEVYLTKCSRGKDDDGIPKFDWECSITHSISKTLTYLEHTRDLSDIKQRGFNLTYTSIDYAPSG